MGKILKSVWVEKNEWICRFFDLLMVRFSEQNFTILIMDFHLSHFLENNYFHEEKYLILFSLWSQNCMHTWLKNILNLTIHQYYQRNDTRCLRFFYLAKLSPIRGFKIFNFKLNFDNFKFRVISSVIRKSTNNKFYIKLICFKYYSFMHLFFYKHVSKRYIPEVSLLWKSPIWFKYAPN